MRKKIHPAKRLFDLIIVVVSAPLALPVTLLAMSAVTVENILRGRSSDPVFYRDIRVSGGVPFTLYKFNIFRGDVIDSLKARGEVVHTKQLEWDGDLTLTGKVLKQIYMDELPQVWCVLRGDMSIVGPRPVNQATYERFLNEGITVKSQIHAGLTGPYQSLKDDHSASSHLLDQAYIDFVATEPWYAIIFNDMRILLRTAKVVLKAKGL